MMATVRRVVCVLAAALCCTALCVTASAALSAQPTGTGTLLTTESLQVEPRSQETPLVSEPPESPDELAAKKVLQAMAGEAEKVLRVVHDVLEAAVVKVVLPSLETSFTALTDLSASLPPGEGSKIKAPVEAKNPPTVASVREAKVEIGKAALKAAEANSSFSALGDKAEKAVENAKAAAQVFMDALKKDTGKGGAAFVAVADVVKNLTDSGAVAVECQDEAKKIAKLVEITSLALDAAANVTQKASAFAKKEPAEPTEEDNKELDALRTESAMASTLVYDALKDSVDVTVSAALLLNRTRKLLNVMKTVKLNDKGIKTLAGAFDAIGTAKEAALKFLKGSEVALPEVETKLTEVIEKIDDKQLAATLTKAREHIAPVEDAVKSLSTQPEKAAEIPANVKSDIGTGVEKVNDSSSNSDGLAKSSTPTIQAAATKVSEALESETSAGDAVTRVSESVGKDITADTTAAAQLVAGIDGSEIPTWVRDPLMLLLLACVAVW
ncbi:hypothetical protein DQ04_07761020 [Trypanosoma grayi]|uniref:hypothetical protein n=1 Tax=Trypanosoma grayi TaxID=71804 RepID=UPI0004F4645C|nr:hypothetical protein DQ04_07761020 [Trypanosoma grayi]KEG08198.1 hypothetical protein DQ04_07761020 [Trypanosoma grayi]